MTTQCLTAVLKRRTYSENSLSNLSERSYIHSKEEDGSLLVNSVSIRVASSVKQYTSNITGAKWLFSSTALDSERMRGERGDDIYQRSSARLELGTLGIHGQHFKPQGHQDTPWYQQLNCPLRLQRFHYSPACSSSGKIVASNQCHTLKQACWDFKVYFIVISPLWAYNLVWGKI